MFLRLTLHSTMQSILSALSGFIHVKTLYWRPLAIDWIKGEGDPYRGTRLVVVSTAEHLADGPIDQCLGHCPLPLAD